MIESSTGIGFEKDPPRFIPRPERKIAWSMVGESDGPIGMKGRFKLRAGGFARRNSSEVIDGMPRDRGRVGVGEPDDSAGTRVSGHLDGTDCEGFIGVSPDEEVAWF